MTTTTALLNRALATQGEQGELLGDRARGPAKPPIPRLRRDTPSPALKAVNVGKAPTIYDRGVVVALGPVVGMDGYAGGRQPS